MLLVCINNLERTILIVPISNALICKTMESKEIEKIEEHLNAETSVISEKEKMEKHSQPARPTGLIEKRVEIDSNPTAHPAVTITPVSQDLHKGEPTSEATAGTQAEQLTMVPSRMHEYYKYESFGQPNTAMHALAGRSYNVNLRPLAIDQSPLKELVPDFSEVQPITAYKKALGHENSYVYTFYLPDGVRDSERYLRNDCPYGTTTAWSIPALTVLKENLIGLPLQGLEWPVIASANPTPSNSYLHAVTHRVGKSGVLDLRFKISGSRKYNVKEIYVLGRIWTPLTQGYMIWENSAENYDAAQPTVYPAFADIGKITLDTRKELTNLTQMLRFVDKTFPPDIEQSMVNILEHMGRNKLSLSRLYWRIWCCIAESTLCEAQDKRWKVHKIHNPHTPMALNGPLALKELFSESQMAVQPFFLTHNMLDSIGCGNLIEIFQFLLSENFEARCHFMLSKNWPSLGQVRVILPSGHTTLHSAPTRLIVPSESLYAILSYFARALGQQHLIDEIGKTVAIFLMRPEGDHLWLGHNFITLKLPPFRCKRTLHLAWANTDVPLDYPMKTPPFYKLAWLGSIRYLQIGLCANTVLSELGVFSGLQLENSGIKMTKEWCAAMYRLFQRDRGSCEFNFRMQHISLRCDWGCILNRITSSVVIIRPLLVNFVRVPQWQEWLLFQRIQPESTWMSGQMGHITPKTILQPCKSYNPTLCGIESGLGDIYYRLISDGTAEVTLHAASFSMGTFITRKAQALCSTTGLPLDGQFRHLRLGDDIDTYYHFIVRSEIACGRIMNDWYKKKEYHWQLCCDQNFMQDGFGKRDGEIWLESSAAAPVENINTGFIGNPRLRGPQVELVDSHEARGNDVIVYGNPPGDGDDPSVDEWSSTEEADTTPYPEGVPISKLHEQKYPIHYCRAKREPSAGLLMLRYGIALSIATAGICALSNQELYSMASRGEVLHELSQYEPPHTRASNLARDGSPLRSSSPTQAEQARCAPTNNDSLSRMERVARKIEKKNRKRAEERRAALAEMQELEARKMEKNMSAAGQVVNIDVEKWKGGLRTFAQSINADISLLEADSAWQSWDQLAKLNQAEPLVDEDARLKYQGILRLYGNRDLVVMLRLVPRLVRIELCKALIGLLEESAPYLLPCTRDIRAHERIVKFLTIAKANMSFCNVLTEAELQADQQCQHMHFTQWHLVGTLNYDSYFELVKSWSKIQYECPFAYEHQEPTPAQRLAESKGSAGIESPYTIDKKWLEDTVIEPEEISTLDNVMDVTIIRNVSEEMQDFQSARGSCSAQSLHTSASSHAASSSSSTFPKAVITAEVLQIFSSATQASTPVEAVQSKTCPTTKTPASTKTTPKTRGGVTNTSTVPKLTLTPSQQAWLEKRKKDVPGSAVANRTRAQTKMAAALQGVFATGSSLQSYHSLDDSRSKDVTSVTEDAEHVMFEKTEAAGNADNAQESENGSPTQT